MTDSVLNRSSLTWCEWSEVPWFGLRNPTGRIVAVCERLLDKSTQTTNVKDFQQHAVAEIAAEFSAQWAGIVVRSDRWTSVLEHGRLTLDALPQQELSELAERDAGLSFEVEGSGRFIAITLHLEGQIDGILAICGRAVDAQLLPALMSVGRALDIATGWARQREAAGNRIQRLESTLKIASSLTTVCETEPLLELIAEEATRLMDCDRASIFIWDRDSSEVIACPALGLERGSLRLPDNTGIVGQVIHSGEAARVDDVQRDPRFSSDVDKSSGYQTRNLLCVPLHDADGKMLGAFEVLNKSHGHFTDDDGASLSELGVQAAAALRNTREREEIVRSHRELTEQVTRGVKIIGDSSVIASLRNTINRLAETDLPVLILGESGTGKEVVAQALHFHGPRSEKPFVAVNCAALAESLLESELFGHEAGAFTDARETRKGKFELADGGTLFLDEIGDMTLGGQAKLLRVLEQKVITRVGGSQVYPVNVRVVAATNVNLHDAVRARKFREDLYYRLGVVTLKLPPLRERPEDILPLADFFLSQFAVQAKRRSLRLSNEARKQLQAHPWPGNIRELRNLMERLAFLAAEDEIQAGDLAFILSPQRDGVFEPSPDMGLSDATAEFQQDYIRKAIRRMQGNMSEAARLLGLHRSNLYRKMRQLQMTEVDSFDEGD